MLRSLAPTHSCRLSNHLRASLAPALGASNPILKTQQDLSENSTVQDLHQIGFFIQIHFLHKMKPILGGVWTQYIQRVH